MITGPVPEKCFISKFKNIMKSQFVFLLLIFTGCCAVAQRLSVPAANDFLPAFQKDDSVGFKAAQAIHKADPELLLCLAGASSCPKIFSYLVLHHPGVDTELPLRLALGVADDHILKMALDRRMSLGEYPVNQLLAAVWGNDDDDGYDPAGISEYMMGMSLPDAAFGDYKLLLPAPVTAASRAKTATWLIAAGQDFDFLDLPKLQLLAPEYKDVTKALYRRLGDLPEGGQIPGFGSRRQALLFAAVLNDDLAELKRIAENVQTLEMTIADQSLLNYAVDKAGLPVIKFLLGNGANADWSDQQSGKSVLGTALARRDKAVLAELMLYLKPISFRDGSGDMPVLFCVKRFFECPVSPEQLETREFYFYALKELRRAGADFDQYNGRYETAVNLLPVTMEDSLARSVVLLVLEKTADQRNLGEFSSSFRYTDQKDMPVLALLCQKLLDPGPLFYNRDLEGAKLFQLILQQSVNLPDTRVFSVLLRSACYQKDIQKVRWILNDVPLLYLKRNAGLNSDSLRKSIVNAPVAGYNENVLYYFLQHSHTPDWHSRSVVKALMAAGADMYQLQSQDKKRPIDLFMESDSYQKQYSNEIISGLLATIAFDFGAPDAWEKVPATGDFHRKSILSYQGDKKWLESLKNCLELDFGGAGTVGNARRVRVTGFGIVELGKFPLSACEPLDLSKIVTVQGQYAYMIGSGAGVRTYLDYPLIEGYNYMNACAANFSIKGSTGIENLTFKLKSKIDIPAAALNESEHFIPPMIIVHNNGDPVLVHQGGIVTTIVKNAQAVLDRSKGAIKLEYQFNGDRPDFRMDIFGRIEDTIFPDLLIPDQNDVQSRLKLYGEVVRLVSRIRDNANRTEEEKILRRQDEVTVHLLSEYALQRGYPKKVKEESDLNVRQLEDLDRLLGPLGEFYAKHTVLDFNSALYSVSGHLKLN
jgi:hypothetical protein